MTYQRNHEIQKINFEKMRLKNEKKAKNREID